MGNLMITEKKKILRRSIAELKSRYDFQWKCATSCRILQHLENLDIFKSANTILVYHALPDEVQTSQFLDRWFRKKRILLPLVIGNDLVLKEYSPDKIVSGYKGIPEPSQEALTVDPVEVELAIIPGVAFDSDCYRLGRGKGFYDRLIPSLKVPLLGIAFDFQIVDKVPVEIFDRKLDMVLTESALFE